MDTEAFTEGITGISGSPISQPKKKEKKLEPKPLAPLSKKIMKENKQTLLDVLYPGTYSADDKLFNKSLASGYKAKQSKDIRSHWNNKNWKRYYDYELGNHEQQHRQWWTNDDAELAKKHMIF